MNLKSDLNSVLFALESNYNPQFYIRFKVKQFRYRLTHTAV